MIDFEPNEIGLARWVPWDSDTGGWQLEPGLESRGIPFEKAEIPHLVGMGGCAWLVFYMSPNTKGLMTVLCVPKAAIDSFAIDYFYFPGVSKEHALESEQVWLDRYDVCVEMKRVSWAKYLEERTNGNA
jgi:hypothetical protein